jgi:hypothetical protein
MILFSNNAKQKINLSMKFSTSTYFIKEQLPDVTIDQLLALYKESCRINNSETDKEFVVYLDANVTVMTWLYANATFAV